MSTPQHTQGLLAVNPLQLNQIATADGAFEVAMVTVLHPAQVTVDNARRLVACWNACVAIPTDDLEECPEGGLFHLADHANQLAIQRDELLDELRNIADADPSKWDAEVHDQFQQWAQSRARAAISKAKRGAA